MQNAKIVWNDEKFSIYPQCDDKHCEDIIYDNCDRERDEIKVLKNKKILRKPEIVDWIISSLGDKVERKKNIFYLRGRIKEKYKDCSLIELESSNTYYIILKQSCLDYPSRKTCA
ncbi:hypothetical protein [Sulfurimonas sp. RIFOXYB12_FULL_35_9]|uniref:hypothetical protein n=1 Tax=Sulfurimonas sp. RIFOXYB12_FULL_35_9 TaxID=1802256 RepID=UPI0008B17AC1|nr:hypothetical protein [Sulfurimonas sp. RIFOXYB12_FULL_35_9]OHE06476.1 MAG: hypothetical protein A2345_07950 [Sulfurimonas sp. RIFOXYB12_FULL_35_9]